MDIKNQKPVPETFPNPYDSKYWYREGDIYRFIVTKYNEDVGIWFTLDEWRKFDS